jgi:hypothetical protein
MGDMRKDSMQMQEWHKRWVAGAHSVDELSCILKHVGLGFRDHMFIISLVFDVLCSGTDNKQKGM